MLVLEWTLHVEIVAEIDLPDEIAVVVRFKRNVELLGVSPHGRNHGLVLAGLPRLLHFPHLLDSLHSISFAFRTGCLLELDGLRPLLPEGNMQHHFLLDFFLLLMHWLRMFAVAGVEQVPQIVSPGVDGADIHVEGLLVAEGRRTVLGENSAPLQLEPEGVDILDHLGLVPGEWRPVLLVVGEGLDDETLRLLVAVGVQQHHLLHIEELQLAFLDLRLAGDGLELVALVGGAALLVGLVDHGLDGGGLEGVGVVLALDQSELLEGGGEEQLVLAEPFLLDGAQLVDLLLQQFALQRVVQLLPVHDLVGTGVDALLEEVGVLRHAEDRLPAGSASNNHYF